MFKRMLNHPQIEVILNTDYKKILNNIKFNKMIYTGPIDYFFDYEFGKLHYRSIRFEYKNYQQNKNQDSAVINYIDMEVDFSRVTEYKYLTGQELASTTLSYEYFQKDGDPYYPIPNNENTELAKKYFEVSTKLNSVLFLGRLAEYKYYNMDQVVAAAHSEFENLKND